MLKVLSYPPETEHQLRSFDFSAGEVQVRLDPLPPDLKEVTVEADIRNSRDLVETALTLDAINHQTNDGNTSIRLILRYLPYSRQDRPCTKGEAFSLRTALSILTSPLVPGDTLVTWDVHSPVAQTLVPGGVSFVNVKAADLIQDLFSKVDLIPDPETIVISPDKGAVDRATEVQKALGLSKTVYASKVRDPDSGAILRTEVPEYVDYKGKNLLIVDDICDGGRTFIELAKVLRTYEPAQIDLYVTHGIFSKGFHVFENLIDNFLVANLFPPATTQVTPENLYYLYRQ
jgi:ribose-phosphate pyrophosphokinase